MDDGRAVGSLKRRYVYSTRRGVISQYTVMYVHITCFVLHFIRGYLQYGDRGSTEVKVPCYKSEGRWFDRSWCQWIFR